MYSIQKYGVIFFTIICSKLFAQDIHFSQYYFSPLSLNPANTGNYRGDYRFFANYRSQWREISKAYNTMSAGGDFNFFPKNRQFSAGLIFISDKSGGNLSVNKTQASFAYHLKSKGFKIHFGIQPALIVKTLNFNANTFPNQLNWTIGGYDNTLPNNEAFGSSVHSYFDLNAGTNVSHKFGKLEPEIGLTIFHITQPKESFFDRKNTLPIRQGYNVAISYSATANVILKFHSLYGYTTKSSDWVSGITSEYVLSRGSYFDNSLFFGLMWRSGIGRNSDAGIATAGLNYKHYTLGFSYDITFSQLKTAVNSKGAFELAFIYRAKSTRLVKKIIPCERY